MTNDNASNDYNERNNDDKNPHHHCYKCRFPSSPITPKSWTLPKAPLLVADRSRVLLLAFHQVGGHHMVMVIAGGGLYVH